jgi:hypothetical protein
MCRHASQRPREPAPAWPRCDPAAWTLLVACPARCHQARHVNSQRHAPGRMTTRAAHARNSARPRALRGKSARSCVAEPMHPYSVSGHSALTQSVARSRVELCRHRNLARRTHAIRHDRAHYEANPDVCRWHDERIVMWWRGTAGCSLRRSARLPAANPGRALSLQSDYSVALPSVAVLPPLSGALHRAGLAADDPRRARQSAGDRCPFGVPVVTRPALTGPVRGARKHRSVRNAGRLPWCCGRSSQPPISRPPARAGSAGYSACERLTLARAVGREIPLPVASS